MREAHLVVQPRRSFVGSRGFFYLVFVPAGAAANLILGLIVLRGLRADSDIGWVQLGAGVFCCMIAGWLAAVAWLTFYWNRSMTRQVAAWTRITDTIFAWLEEAPLPLEAVNGLKTSLDDVVSPLGAP